MLSKRKIYYLLATLLAINFVLTSVIWSLRSRQLKIIFLDVGQGDAILISKGSNQMLIDGGADSKIILEKLGKYVPFWDRQLEIVLATHPDQDHIGGLLGVMKNYRVARVIESDASSDSQVFKNYQNQIKEKGIARIIGQKGLKLKIEEVVFEILYPLGSESKEVKDTNAQSLVGKLTFGDNSFLFTGDLPSEKEDELIFDNSNFSARVLKVAHHGSKYSTSAEFLEKSSFKEAIISVGASNRYGHPAPEVLDRLKAKNIKILRTDTQGDIVYECAQKEKLCVVRSE